MAQVAGGTRRATARRLVIVGTALALAASVVAAAVLTDRHGHSVLPVAGQAPPARVRVATPSIPVPTAPPSHRASAAPRVLIAPDIALGTVAGIPGGPRVLPRGAVALTFDDGPDPEWTAQVLAILRRYRAGATFFDIGNRVAAYPQLARAEYADGNGVGSHTFTHPDLTTLSVPALRAQLSEADGAITAATGHRPVCLRPPYNAFDLKVEEQTALDHEALVSYDLDPRDWARPGTAAIVAAVLSRVHAGSVVDLHDGGGDRSETVAALPAILQGLAVRGLVSVPLCR